MMKAKLVMRIGRRRWAAGRIEGGLITGRPPSVPASRELHDEDGVLARQSHHHHQPICTGHVVVAAAEPRRRWPRTNIGTMGSRLSGRLQPRTAPPARGRPTARQREDQQRGPALGHLLVGEAGPLMRLAGPPAMMLAMFHAGLLGRQPAPDRRRPADRRRGSVASAPPGRGRRSAARHHAADPAPSARRRCASSGWRCRWHGRGSRRPGRSPGRLRPKRLKSLTCYRAIYTYGVWNRSVEGNALLAWLGARSTSALSCGTLLVGTDRPLEARRGYQRR